MASVLVVDDEPDLRYLAQVNLQFDGHTVMTAGDGREALAAVQAEVPDVILLDVMMPEVDGWTVLQQLKGHLDDRISSVRVIMLTALGEDTDRLRGGIEGAVRYLIKPVDPDDLRAAVNEALTGDERDQRRRAQTGALVELAQRETGGSSDDAEQPRPRLARLEHLRPRLDEVGGSAEGTMVIGETLTTKQRQLLAVLGSTPSVSDAAGQLGVSRSNVYASLRRIARKIDADSVPDLLRSLRSGELRVVEE